MIEPPQPYSGWDSFGLFTDERGLKCLLPKTCYTYPAMMKLGTVIPYLKEIQCI